MKTRKRGRAQRKGRPLLPPSECYCLVNASPPNYRQWVGLNYGPIFRRLWVKVHQITSADAGDVAKFRGDRPRDRGNIALNKKRKERSSSKT